MRTVRTRGGAEIPVIGQGTWTFGESLRSRAAEIKALQRGFDLGMTLVDTAEMYGRGGSEEVVGEALRGRRHEIYVVTKVLPEDASRKGTRSAAERSLKRLRTDHIDLHLLHWEGSHPFEETLAGFLDLVREGKILEYGISNVDVGPMEEILALEGGSGLAADQVLYNPLHRGVERKLLKQAADHGLVVMAYSPFEEGRLNLKGAIGKVAGRLGVSPATVALAWTVRHAGVAAVPKAVDLGHVEENAAAGSLVLEEQDLALIDAEFPAPEKDVPLEMI